MSSDVPDIKPVKVNKKLQANKVNTMWWENYQLEVLCWDPAVQVKEFYHKILY
jgi:hypothetical protein